MEPIRSTKTEQVPYIGPNPTLLACVIHRWSWPCSTFFGA